MYNAFAGYRHISAAICTEARQCHPGDRRLREKLRVDHEHCPSGDEDDDDKTDHRRQDGASQLTKTPGL